MRIFKFESYKEYSIFFWIIFVSVLGIVASLFYSQNKVDQSTKIKSSLDNIYFQKTIKEHTSTLAYAIDKKGSHANLNHLEDFKTKVNYVKSKTR